MELFLAVTCGFLSQLTVAVLVFFAAAARASFVATDHDPWRWLSGQSLRRA
jgi:hypothetical protein